MPAPLFATFRLPVSIKLWYLLTLGLTLYVYVGILIQIERGRSYSRALAGPARILAPIEDPGTDRKRLKRWRETLGGTDRKRFKRCAKGFTVPIGNG